MAPEWSRFGRRPPTGPGAHLWECPGGLCCGRAGGGLGRGGAGAGRGWAKMGGLGGGGGEARGGGDSEGLGARLDKLTSIAEEKAGAARAARDAARAEALARKTTLVEEAEQIAAE